MKCEHTMKRKEAVMAYFKVSWLHLPEGSE